MMNEISSDGSATQWLFMVAATWDYMGEGAHALNGFGQIDVRDVMVLKLTLDGDKVWARQVRRIRVIVSHVAPSSKC